MKRMPAYFLLACLVALGHAGRTAQAQGEPDYYPLKPGTKWFYQVSAAGQVVKASNEIEKTEVIGGETLALQKTIVNGQVTATEHLTSDRRGVVRHRFNGMEIKPALVLLKSGFKPGDTWQIDHQAGADQVKGTAKVGEFTEVQVMAGKYKAIPVTLSSVVKGQNITTTYWFAAGVGIVKQTATIGAVNVSMELEKIEMPK